MIEILIEGHAFAYAGCKSDASPILHEGAFFSPLGCGIPPYVDRKPTYIRAWREKKHLTLDQVVGRLAEIEVPMTGASLSRIERGLQPYQQDTIEAIAVALDVSVAQLVEDDPSVPEATLIDFVRHLDAKRAAQAEAVLRAMFTDAPAESA